MTRLPTPPPALAIGRVQPMVSCYNLRGTVTTTLAKPLGSGDLRITIMDTRKDERIVSLELDWDQIAQLQEALRRVD